ncbi:MAG: hypothetical protein HRU37_07095 [Roseibacillus sp.]|nr:hypothetical protein [Roseibacillus sp.]
MKTLLITLWCLLPIGLAAFHFGPGQDLLKFDDTEAQLAQAREAVANEEWGEAVETYQDALAKLPRQEKQLAYQIRLETAKAMMLNKQLPTARQDLAKLVTDLDNDEAAPQKLRDAARSALANARYYMTYLMKLEGLPDTAWEPEIEAARQEYKLLATSAANSELAKRSADDLESAIRLARMDPAELYGLPIPSQ